MSNPRFDGFSVPDVGIIPPEFYDILPHIKLVTELKVLIICLRITLSFENHDIPISLNDLSTGCGLNHTSILRGIRAGLKRRTLVRIKWGKSFVYRVNFIGLEHTFGYHNDTPSLHALHSSTSNKHKHALQATRKSKAERERIDLTARLCGLGVATRVALDLIQKHDAKKLKRHIQYTEFARDTNLAHRPAAWFVASVRDNWGPPLGFKDSGKWLANDPVYQKAVQETEERYYRQHPETRKKQDGRDDGQS